jgi:arylsulfatase A-like enzyme
MSKLAVRTLAVLLAVAGLWLACRGKGAQSAEGKPTQPTQPVGEKQAIQSLDDKGPKMDLLASRSLWHIYRQGLVIPFTGEGFRKYSQEYNNPWRSVTKLEGRVGRVLSSTAATLHFPWGEGDEEATLIARMHGGSAGKKLSLRLNGRPIKNATLEAGWQTVVAPVPARLLVKGENTLSLGTGKKGALFHSIEMVAGRSPEAMPDWPPSAPVGKISVGGKEYEALAGFPRMMIPIELPKDAWLVLGTAGAGRFRVSLAREDQPAKLLLDEKQGHGTVHEHRLELSGFSGELVALSLEVQDAEGEAGWLAPQILLAKAKLQTRPQAAKNLVVLVADALRADKLPMYGKTRVQTPNIESAARTTGITFSTAHAASPSSPPSHASIQSGCVPRSHGILGDKSKVNPGTPMVSAILAKAGIATEFVGDASFAMKRLQPASTWTEFHQPNGEGKGGDCSAVVKELLAFADKHADKRFFVSSVAFEAHTPYLYHQGTTEHYFDGAFDDAIGKHPDGVILTSIVAGRLKMTSDRWAQLKGLYDGEVEHLDGCFGKLMDGLKARGRSDDTPVILLADHGEGFLEHGSMGHAYGHTLELTHVPLVFFIPGVGHGQKISTVVSHTDVVPTILDLMGIQADERLQGESLLPMMLREGPWVPRVVPSEYGRSYSLRSLDLHYIVDYGGNESLYDVASDPAEKTEIKDKRPLALRYFRDLAGIYLAHRAKWRTAGWGTLNNHRPGFVATQGR